MIGGKCISVIRMKSYCIGSSVPHMVVWVNEETVKKSVMAGFG
jgi:hypothetical protein